MALHDNFGANVKRRRLELRLTQAELAEKTGMQRETIAQFEAGKNDNPTLRTIEKMATALNCSAISLLVQNENVAVAAE